MAARAKIKEKQKPKAPPYEVAKAAKARAYAEEDRGVTGVNGYLGSNDE